MLRYLDGRILLPQLFRLGRAVGLWVCAGSVKSVFGGCLRRIQGSMCIGGNFPRSRSRGRMITSRWRAVYRRLEDGGDVPAFHDGPFGRWHSGFFIMVTFEGVADPAGRAVLADTAIMLAFERPVIRLLSSCTARYVRTLWPRPPP